MANYEIVPKKHKLWKQGPRALSEMCGVSLSSAYLLLAGKSVGAKVIAAVLGTTGLAFDALFDVHDTGTYRSDQPAVGTPVAEPVGSPLLAGQARLLGLPLIPNPIPQGEGEKVYDVHGTYYLGEDDAVWLVREQLNTEQMRYVLNVRFGLTPEQIPEHAYVITNDVARAIKEKEQADEQE